MKPDPETQQMLKRSIRDDRANSMTGGVMSKSMPKKPSDTARKQTAKSHTGQTVAKGPTGGRAASSNIGLRKAPVNIPMGDMSPEFKRLVVDELIRIGRARVVRRKGREAMAREEKEKKKEKKKEQKK